MIMVETSKLMATVDIVKEEVLNISHMNQCSHYQDSPGEEAQPMEGILVTHPMGFSGKPK